MDMENMQSGILSTSPEKNLYIKGPVRAPAPPRKRVVDCENTLIM